ncbi:T9SS type A sorting domain-containing protein [Robiginitalea sediminis]|uniref:T9SS type A sorting domain-containing protein n=1 Tax=Robiginitalea sediminis TaxID=1982593 RepID=UPI000B4B1A17|nr:T9SS type A sorting domain-containing protein [Robiginitalea sediminis]
MKYLYLLLFAMGTFVLSAQQADPAPGAREASFTLSPNPASGDVVFISGGTNAPKTIRIYDLFGKVVLQRRLQDNSLPIHPLVPGVYMVQIEQGANRVTRKLVVR